MNLKKLEELFYNFSEECPLDGFSLIENKLSIRSDIHALLLLDRLLPSKKSIITAAGHDVIYLGIDLEDLAEVITEDQIKELVYSGVSFDSDKNSLYMFI